MGNYFRGIYDSSAKGQKSNVMNPLIGITSVFIAGSIISHRFDVTYLTIVLIGLSVISGLGFIIGYFFCLFKNPDLLRSEKYNIQKSALENAAMFGNNDNPITNSLPNPNRVIVEGLLATNQEDENEE